MEDARGAIANKKAILRPDEVADELRVSRDTIYRLIREGKLVAIRVGFQLRIRAEDYREFTRRVDLREELY